MSNIQKTNPGLVELIQELKKSSWKNDAPIWRDIAKRLEGPSKNLAEVNIGRIARYVEKGEMIVIPGKVLGSGEIGVPVTVGAWRFSDQARQKIEKAGGKVLDIQSLLKARPKGEGIRIIY